MSRPTRTETHFTTAPRAYDWSQVLNRTPTGLADSRGREFYRVEIGEFSRDSIEYQIGRYVSGLHVVLRPEQWNEIRPSLREVSA